MLDRGRLRPAPDARASLEELRCQLAAREGMPEMPTFARLDPPDGGVECFWRLPGGSEDGWQAKLFANGVNAAQKRPIAKSAGRAQELAERIAGTPAAGRRGAAAGEEDDSYHPQPFGSEAYRLDKPRFLPADPKDSAKSGECASASTRAPVARSGAGAGGTRLFCGVAERRNGAGPPAIPLHGPDLEEVDPLPRIKVRLDLDTTTSEFLPALDAAGEAGGSRALVLADAPGEGGGTSVRNRRLAGLLDPTGRYPWASAAFSARTTHERLVIPGHTVPDRAASTTHAGFGSMAGKAARAFFDGGGGGGTGRPGMPMLAPDLLNPPSLTILCRGLTTKGVARMPEGELSPLSAYSLPYIESVSEKLSGPGRLGRPAKARLAGRAMGAVARPTLGGGSWRAGCMAAHEGLGRIRPENRESLPLPSLLICEWMPSEDQADTEAGPRRAAGFARERTAENLAIRPALHGSTVDDPLRLPAGGGKLAECLKAMQSHMEMIDAPPIQMPERPGRELVGVTPGGAAAALHEPFPAGLACSIPSGAGPRAAALADECLKRYGDPHAALAPLLAAPVARRPCRSTRERRPRAPPPSMRHPRGGRSASGPHAPGARPLRAGSGTAGRPAPAGPPGTRRPRCGSLPAGSHSSPRLRGHPAPASPPGPAPAQAPPRARLRTCRKAQAARAAWRGEPCPAQPPQGASSAARRSRARRRCHYGRRMPRSVRLPAGRRARRARRPRGPAEPALRAHLARARPGRRARRPRGPAAPLVAAPPASWRLHRGAMPRPRPTAPLVAAPPAGAAPRGSRLSSAFLITIPRVSAAMPRRPDPCPFCGGRPVKRGPWLAGARISAKGGGIGGSLRSPGPCDTYLKCNGCMIEYVSAERDIETILRGLRVEHEVAFQMRCYYGEAMTVEKLLAGCRTAIVRRANRRRSVLSVSVDGSELIVCFLHEGVRTFGSFVKTDDGPGGTSHYVFRSLSRA